MGYFRHAVAKHTFSKLDSSTFWRLARMLRARHGWSWGQLRGQLTAATGRWQIAADGVKFLRIESHGLPLRRPGHQDPIPSGHLRTPPDRSNRGEPVAQ